MPRPSPAVDKAEGGGRRKSSPPRSTLRPRPRWRGSCADLGIPFVHISTDYVFTTAPARPRVRPIAPTAPPWGPMVAPSWPVKQGSSRQAVPMPSCARSWVVSAHGANFVKTMLRVGPARGHLRVVDDQIGGPTPAADIAAACLEDRGPSGRAPGGRRASTISPARPTRPGRVRRSHPSRWRNSPSWWSISRQPEYPLPAPRPLNSRLDCSRTEAVFRHQAPRLARGTGRDPQ